jgi:uncharacterized membrane protein
MIVVPAAVASTGFLKPNVAAAIAYVTFIPAIVFLLIRPFNRNRLVRFHSFQSIFFAISAFLAAIALRVLFSVLGIIPHAGYLLGSLAVAIVLLGFVILWLVLLVKALQAELFALPVIGKLAERA